MKLLKQFLFIVYLLNGYCAMAQVSAKASVYHLTDNTSGNLGHIVLDVSGGTSPYTYSWSPGAITNKDLTYASAGDYTVKITDNASNISYYYYKLGYKTKWMDFYGSKFEDDSLKLDGGGVYNRTAVSKNTLGKNTDGWCEFVVPPFVSPYVLGFLDTVVAAAQGTPNDIDFSFHISTGNTLYAFAGGSFYYYGTANVGDVLRMERVGSTWYLKKNNSTIHTMSATTEKQKLKAQFYTSPIGAIGVSFPDTFSLYRLRRFDMAIDHIEPDGIDSLGSMYPQVTTGTTPFTYSWSPANYTSDELLNVKTNTYTVKIKDVDNDSVINVYKLGYKTKWKSFFGTTYSNDTLYAHAASTPSGSGSAIMVNELRPNTNGWVQSIVTDFQEPCVLGFLDSNSVASSGDHNDFDFAYHISYGQALYAFSSGGFTPLGTVKKGDVLTLEKNGSTFKLWHNGTNVHSDAALNHKNYKVKAQTYQDSYFARIGTSFADSTTSNSFKAVAIIDHIKNFGLDTNANIIMNMRGGASPYTYTWQPGNTHNRHLYNIGSGSYSLTTKDYNGTTVNYVYNIGQKAEWSSKHRTVSENDSIMPDGTTGGGGGGYDLPTATTANELHKNTNGWAEMVVRSTFLPHVVGFLDSASVAGPADPFDIDFAWHLSAGNVLYAFDGSNFYNIGSADEGDAIGVKRVGSVFHLIKNGVSTFTLPALAHKALKLKAQFNDDGTGICNVGVSSAPKLEVDYYKGDITTDEPNSGYIYLEPKNGIPPYRFKWNDNSTSNQLIDLGAGTYSVMVMDSLRKDTVRLSFNIGEKVRFENVYNMSFNHGKFTKTDMDKPAVGISNLYLKESEDGFYEFEVSNINTNFNFVLRPFDPDTNQSKAQVPIIRTTTISVLRSSLPSPGSSGYAEINFADTITTGTHANVIKKEYIDYNCISSCSTLSMSGIHFDYGYVYTLIDGYTIKKGTLVDDGDVLTIKKISGDLKVYNNGSQISSNIYALGDAIIGTMVLAGPEILLENFVVGTTATNFNPYADPCSKYTQDNTRNWTHNITYDGNGIRVAESREYTDFTGKVTQTQSRNLSANVILATQVLYDAYGRQVGSTLPAPIGQECFYYKTDFMQDTMNGAYTYNDFDIPDYTTTTVSVTFNEASKPGRLKNSVANTLGWYYSDNNSYESHVPAAKTPYSRVHYSVVDPSEVLKVSKPGRNLNSGSGHETYNFKMATSGELNYVFGAGKGWRVEGLNHFYSLSQCENNVIVPIPLMNTAPLTLKSINVDENGVETIQFFDMTGNNIASCLSGKVNGSNVQYQHVQAWLDFKDETKRYIDFHLPDGCENTFAIIPPNSAQAGTPIYNFINLKTGRYVMFGSTIDYYYSPSSMPSLAPGYYRMVVKYVPAFHTGTSITYKMNYYNFSLNYYDHANRLKAKVSPKAQANNYVYTGDPDFNPSLANFKVIPTNDNDPDNFPPDTSWSLSPSAFSNTINLNLRGIPVDTYKNISLFVNFGGKYESLMGADTTTGVGVDPIFGDSTAAGNFCEVKYALQDTVFASPPDGGFGCDQNDIYFHIKVALLDASNNIISGSEQESNSLHCVMNSCGGTNYNTWYPIQFEFSNSYDTSGSVRVQDWKKLKILEFHPIMGTYEGQNFADLMHVIDLLKMTINAADISNTVVPHYGMVDRYRYNSLSEVWNANEIEKGLTEFAYADDGKLKFTQNSKQDASHATTTYRYFNYLDYDQHDRPIVSGEIHPSTSASVMKYYFESYQEKELNGPPPFNHCSVHNILNVNNHLALSQSAISLEDVVYLTYDRPDINFYTETGLSSSDYVQKHLPGEISTSYNSAKKTWYSYDEQGNVEWIVQKYYHVNAVGDPDEHMVKTFNYEYDFLGNVTKVIYNKEEADDRFYNYYEYDQDKRVTRVYTGRASTERVLQAKYKFYAHGPLKRIELADKMQAIDFVYTINNWVKTLNGPEMSKDYDPGKDGYLVENMANTTYKDIFGLGLDYYLNDYEREATRIQSYDESQNTSTTYAPDLFNGIIKGMRWQTRTPAAYIGLSYPNQHLMYGYKYDKKYQLLEAKFATVTGNSTQNRPSTESGSPTLLTTSISNDYRVDNIAYDYNGNLLTLTRKAYAASANGINLDNLTYNYNSCSNKLNYVSDAVSTNPYNTLGFKPGQSSNNNEYNAIGEMTLNVNDGKKYTYNSNGNITGIRDASNNNIAQYTYDENGFRIMKISWLGNGNKQFTWYVRDDNGNIITTSEKTSTASAIPYNNLNFAGEPNEWAVYGSGRLGTLDNTGGNENYIYELSDHLGNVRATFKVQSKTTISNNYDGTGDDNWFMAKAAGGAFASLAPPYNNGTSIKTQQPNYPYGSGSRLIPVKNGDNVTIAWKNFFTASSAPAGGMFMQLTDAAGNPLPNCWQIILNTGSQNTWNSQNTTYAVTANYADMYLSFYPVNLDGGGAIVYYDDMSLTFNTGALREPEQLNMATYYPHGSVMPGLDYNSSYPYKHGYQGQFAEKDDETNESFFELRNYDPLLGRFNSTDPYSQYFSPYMAMNNSHPNSVDPDGGWSFPGAVIGAGIGAAAGITWAVIHEKRNGADVQTHMLDLGVIVGSAAVVGIIGGYHKEIFGQIKRISHTRVFGRSHLANEVAAYRISWPVLNRLINGKKSGSFYFKINFGKYKTVTQKTVTRTHYRFDPTNPANNVISFNIGKNDKWTAHGSGTITRAQVNTTTRFGGHWFHGPGNTTITLQPQNSFELVIVRKVKVKQFRKFGISGSFHKGWKVKK